MTTEPRYSFIIFCCCCSVGWSVGWLVGWLVGPTMLQGIEHTFPFENPLENAFSPLSFCVSSVSSPGRNAILHPPIINSIHCERGNVALLSKHPATNYPDEVAHSLVQNPAAHSLTFSSGTPCNRINSRISPFLISAISID